MNNSECRKMNKLSEKIPAHCRKEFDEVANFNFASAYNGNPNIEATVKEYKGHKLQPTFPSEGIAYAYDNWTPLKGDVLIASFPRTGTNWTTQIVQEILYANDNEQMELSKLLPLQCVFYEGGGPSKFKVLNHLPLLRKVAASHLPATLINVERYKKAGAKIICVIRNPKDQMVSWFHFAKNLPYFQLPPFNDLINCQWNEFYKNCMEGKIPLGLRDGQWYLDYLLTWYPHFDGKNVLRVYFEDMKNDFPAEIRRIANFLSVELTPDQVSKISSDCGFSKMKQTTEEGSSTADEIRKSLKVLHKGEVGGWKDYFTVQQSEEIDKKVEEKLAQTSIKFLY